MEAPRSERWIRVWANLCGAFLLLGFFLPIRVEDDRLHWSWQALPGSPDGLVLGLFVSLILATILLPMGNTLTGLPRAAGLLGVGLVTLALYAVMGGLHRALPQMISGRPVSSFAASALLLGLPLLALGAAVGNHVRKRHPASCVPRVLAGSCGAALVVALMAPVLPKHQAIVSPLLEARPWWIAGGWMLLLVLMLAYGLVAALSFKTLRSPGWFCRLLSALGWTLMLAGPLIVIGALIQELRVPEQKKWRVALPVLKFTLLAYGHAILVAVAAADWIDLVLRKRNNKVVTPAPLG